MEGISNADVLTNGAGTKEIPAKQQKSSGMCCSCYFNPMLKLKTFRLRDTEALRLGITQLSRSQRQPHPTSSHL